MSTLLFLVIGIASLAAGYVFYGRFIARRVGLLVDRPTPAHSEHDGIDFIPASRSVLFGHHFASIAGAGPIVGPIVACQFGFLPAMLWVLLGGIFIGAVHDFTSLVASLRHRGQSLSIVMDKYVGRDGRLLLQVFTLAALILVIGVFTEFVAGVFASDGAAAANAPVATSTSTAFLIAAVAYGLLISPRAWPQAVKTLCALILLPLVLALGQMLPIAIPGVAWPWILGGYIIIAAVTPVNYLLQPRDYLSSFLLLFLLFAGLAGALIGGSTFQAELSDIHWFAPVLGGSTPAVGLFPFLFIVVACGAISGFHSVVASGTTARQVNSERDALPIGFGSMLVECLLALLAIAAVMTLTPTDPGYGTSAVGQFIGGMSGFFASLGIDPSWAGTLITLTVSAFLLTSMDTCTRLARFTLQEMLPKNAGFFRQALPTTIVVAAAGVALSLLKGGSAEAPISAAKMLWPLFGASNQLLAALALLAVSVWLSRAGTIAWYTVLPMGFMLITSVTGLLWHGWLMWQAENILLTILDGFLIALALIMAYRAVPRIFKPRTTPAAESSIHAA